MPSASAPTWDHDFARRSPLFAPLQALAEKLPSIGWPNTEVLNHLAYETGRRMVNARGQRIRFVAADAVRHEVRLGFEAGTWLSGEVPVRALNWHDLLNALVWMTYPRAKACVNARHMEAMDTQTQPQRSPVGDALTHFDEDGVVVLSGQSELSDLLRGFAWKRLLWERRAEVRRSMRFFVFGHALYDKALAPFVGMTGKALVFEVAPALLEDEPERLRAEADRLTALHLLNSQRMLHPAELSPLPLLGVPGWWDANEQAAFYDDAAYFRPGRRSPEQAPPSSAETPPGATAGVDLTAQKDR